MKKIPSLLFFKDITRHDADRAGGKGASLGEMTRAKIPVPPGFVILSSTFDRFIQDTKLASRIDALMEGVNTNEMETVEGASRQIAALINGAEMPKDIQKEILTSFKKLKTTFVAVRSSATAEDSAAAAWAGQLDTYLNTTEKMLLKNVKKCWASLFTPRAIFYRFEQKMGKEQISVAVVVQKMVQSEIAGVAFSVHPVTKNRRHAIIEAGWGLGEAVVSGQITPDSYVVEKGSWDVLDVYNAEQEQQLVRKAGGGNEWKKIPKAKSSKQKLSRVQIVSLAKLVSKIEEHYGFPCDIEWALEKGKWYITQSRPITTL